MKTSDFFYQLPEELIAQTPLEKRDSSRLMLLDKRTGKTEHRRFYELPELLREGDCLVLNDSRVLPARLFGRRPTGGAVEVLLLTDRGDRRWECLVRPGRKARPGDRLIFGDGELEAEILEILDGGNRLIRFEYEGIFLETLERLGRMPLPPYIHKELEDAERYQTVYSRELGSAAAPTAGLHFTPELLEKIRAGGVKTAFVTLHVGRNFASFPRRPPGSSTRRRTGAGESSVWAPPLCAPWSPLRMTGDTSPPRPDGRTSSSIPATALNAWMPW